MYKQNRTEFEEIIRENDIKRLYHFTDRSNLKSIIENGGIYSWKSCESKNINIPRAGGSNLSRNLDCRVGIQDYVHLSFTPQHPMLYDTIEDGRILNPVLLIIDTDVIHLSKTIFSDRNATRNDAQIGSDLYCFKNIHFETIKNKKYFEIDDEEQPFYQAEVMVSEFIPLKYILNINSLENEENEQVFARMKLLFVVPDCSNARFSINSQFYRRQVGGIGNPMTKLQQGEEPDINDPYLRIFNVMYIDGFENPFAIQMGVLNRYSGFTSVINIENDTFTLNPRAVLSSLNGELSFTLL